MECCGDGSRLHIPVNKKALCGRIKNHHGAIGKPSSNQLFCKLDVVSLFGVIFKALRLAFKVNAD